MWVQEVQKRRVGGGGGWSRGAVGVPEEQPLCSAEVPGVARPEGEGRQRSYSASHRCLVSGVWCLV